MRSVAPVAPWTSGMYSVATPYYGLRLDSQGALNASKEAMATPATPFKYFIPCVMWSVGSIAPVRCFLANNHPRSKFKKCCTTREKFLCYTLTDIINLEKSFGSPDKFRNKIPSDYEQYSFRQSFFTFFIPWGFSAVATRTNNFPYIKTPVAVFWTRCKKVIKTFGLRTVHTSLRVPLCQCFSLK